MPFYADLRQAVSKFYMCTTSATDEVNKAILFNKFFYSVFSTSNFMSTNKDVTVDTSVRQHLVSINISEEDVLDALNSLTTKEAR